MNYNVDTQTNRRNTYSLKWYVEKPEEFLPQITIIPALVIQQSYWVMTQFQPWIRRIMYPPHRSPDHIEEILQLFDF